MLIARHPFAWLILALSIAAGSAGYAQGPIEAQAIGRVESPTATKTPDRLLAEIEQQERHLYALYSALNSSDEFDVLCNHKPVASSSGSAMQICEPVFLIKIRLNNSLKNTKQ